MSVTHRALGSPRLPDVPPPAQGAELVVEGTVGPVHVLRGRSEGSSCHTVPAPFPSSVFPGPRPLSLWTGVTGSLNGDSVSLSESLRWAPGGLVRRVCRLGLSHPCPPTLGRVSVSDSTDSPGFGRPGGTVDLLRPHPRGSLVSDLGYPSLWGSDRRTETLTPPRVRGPQDRSRVRGLPSGLWGKDRDPGAQSVGWWVTLRRWFGPSVTVSGPGRALDLRYVPVGPATPTTWS